ncbi:hypothetical protein KEH51_07135 [[Brevibacterium] frigoritolerans]|uniref:Diaminobutyrate decarboxylase n=1 Tax=Peribacillus frigoritolerans TaxID=450367 RepID=A0A941FPV0_9BACI|nr:hypothetical protein [Peribacillus frigoritolerans]
MEAVADELAEFVINDSINVHSPACIGHLHCPTLIPAVAAEMIIGTLNQSMDSWDQSSAATFVEERLIDWLCSQVGLPEQADGIFTSGGTQSNYMGLLLARTLIASVSGVWMFSSKVCQSRRKNCGSYAPRLPTLRSVNQRHSWGLVNSL